MTEEITTYKGFDKNFKCRDFQYEIGQTYVHDGDVEASSSGFHACEHPLDLFSYYPPNQSRFAEVKQSEKLSKHSDDTKIASAKITIIAEISISEMVTRAVKWVFDRSRPEGKTATGEQGAASATGTRGAASATGYQGAASATGRQGAASATGYQGAASATGYQGAASATGYQGAASATGYQGAASATGYQGAASATGRRGAASATGYQGAASATGYQGAASATGRRGAASATGTRGAASATGYQGAALSIGHSGKVMGAEGNALFLVYRDRNTNEILHTWSGIVGKKSVKPNIWYTLNEKGKPVEVE